jgi:Putative Flp pilus-assembly TadE/G-like
MGRAMLNAKLHHPSRLIADEGGNTLMLIAGMFLPLLAMVGSGIDISRAYLTKARLQSACDAGVLAARKSQTGPKATTESTAMGERYFSANYGDGAFGSYSISFDMAGQKNGQIDGVAMAKLDTGVMQVFGQERFDLSVNCSAIRDLSHTDVMFVLDTTGSMLNSNPGDSANRFETMKEAVMGFHESLEATKSEDVNLRYGFVPYAEMVNVGGILPKSMMVDRWTYQSREADGKETSTGTNSYSRNWRHVAGPAPAQSTSTYAPTSRWIPPRTGGEFGGGSSGYWQHDCPRPGDAVNVFDKNKLSERSEPFAGPPVGTRTIQVFRETWDGTTYQSHYNGSQCVLTTTTYDDSIHEFEWVTDPTEDTDHFWRYKPVEYDVKDLIGGGPGSSMVAKIGNDHTDRTVTWHGCIEERDTVTTDDFNPIPSEAFDLDIDSKPTNDPRTQWRPAMPELIFRRPNVDEVRTDANHANLADSWSGAARMCPAPAKRLSAMSALEVELYLDSLVAQGGTHHDIGILWGARLISPSGIFSGDNSGPQSRHIIFMTDGQVETNVYSHDSYGYPWLDRRRLPFPNTDPTDAKLNELVEKRFLAICESARARGLTIWSIAFGTTLSPAMEACSGSNRAFQASDAGELEHAFKKIAGGIARLRLTQ